MKSLAKKADDHTKEPTDSATISPTAADLKQYQRLLLGDWRKRFAVDVLGLLWAVVEKPLHAASKKQLNRLLDPSLAAAFPNDYFATLADRIATAAAFLRWDGMPIVQAPYPLATRHSKTAIQANRFSIFLTFTAHVTLAGNVEFFSDLQALAFQAAIHFVLPALDAKYRVEHANLLNAAAIFVLDFAASDPAHSAYMMSMIHGYLGDREKRLRTLYAAFRFTSPEDHSFLTKAQEYWMELLDLNRHAEAEQFLTSLRWWGLPNQQDEIGEMAHQAYQVIFGGRTRRSGNAG